MIAQHSIEKFAKKLLGESKIEVMLQRLDRLTQEGKTLTLVHRLGNNPQVIINGTQRLLG